MGQRISGAWDTPDYFLRPRGYYLGEPPDEVVYSFARRRSFLAVVTLAGVALFWPVFAKNQPSDVSGPSKNSVLYYVLNFLGNLLGQSVVAMVIGGFYLVGFSLLLVVITKSGHRRRALKQLRWPGAAIVSVTCLFLLGGGVAALVPALTKAAKPEGLAVRALVYVVLIGSLLVIFTWICKSLYLCAVYVFRADDGHPLLAPLVTTFLTWTLALIALSQGGSSGLPHTVGLGVSFLGPVSVTALNLWACRRIHRKFHTLLFRAGPPQEG